MKEDKEYEHNTTKDLEHWLAIFVCVVRHLVESWRSESCNCSDSANYLYLGDEAFYSKV